MGRGGKNRGGRRGGGEEGEGGQTWGGEVGGERGEGGSGVKIRRREGRWRGRCTSGGGGCTNWRLYNWRRGSKWREEGRRGERREVVQIGRVVKIGRGRRDVNIGVGGRKKGEEEV